MTPEEYAEVVREIHAGLREARKPTVLARVGRAIGSFATVIRAAFFPAAAIILLGCLIAIPPKGTVTWIPVPQDPSVSSFNDGYSTAMQDACQQGSAYACQWLKTLNH